MEADIALVHDYLLVMRGAERTFSSIAACWDSAPIYTTLFDEKGTQDRFAGRQVSTSYLQRLNPGQRRFRGLLPLYPSAVSRLPVAQHKVLVSSSSAFAHGIRPGPGAIHVCYCHSPFRYAWHERELALAGAPAVVRTPLRLTLDRLRAWDVAASRQVTHYLANSEITRSRIADFYGRDSTVVHPPVETHRFRRGPVEDFFLVVGELVRHKRVDAALEAARRVGQPIKVVGEGPELPRLRSRFQPGATFLGRVPDEQLADLYSRARALVVPNVEDFGIAAVEAQAAGRPIIGPRLGGTKETVVDGITGVLVPTASVDELSEVMREVDFDRFSPAIIASHAERFSSEHFKERITNEVARAAGWAPNPGPWAESAAPAGVAS